MTDSDDVERAILDGLLWPAVIMGFSVLLVLCMLLGVRDTLNGPTIRETAMETGEFYEDFYPSAYQQGYDDYLEGLSSYDSPYRVGRGVKFTGKHGGKARLLNAERHQAWLKGYNQAKEDNNGS